MKIIKKFLGLLMLSSPLIFVLYMIASEIGIPMTILVCIITVALIFAVFFGALLLLSD